jgi:hypothetical protein
MPRFLTFVALLVLPFAARAGYPNPTGKALAQRYPYSMVGQLTFASGGSLYVGSGTVVQPRGTLTAGHNLYDPVGGWSTDLVFKRGHYDTSDLSVRRPNKIYMLAAYRANANRYGSDSLQAFTRDTGGLFFPVKLAAGSFLGWSANLSLLTGYNRKVALGYGAEIHSGEELLAVAAGPFGRVYGAFYESNGTAIEGGMSGGAVISTMPNGLPALTGTVVSGADFPVAGGIRIIDFAVSSFIITYLSEPPTP